MFSGFYIAKNKSIITGMDLLELLTSNLHAVLQNSSDIVKPLCFRGFTKSCCLDSQVKSGCLLAQTYKCLTKHRGSIFKHKTCTQRRKVRIENMVIVLQNNCTTKIMRILSITSFTYNNITFYLYNGP